MSTRLRYAALICLPVAVGCGAADAVQSVALASSQFSTNVSAYDRELVFQLEVDKYLISDGFIALESSGGAMLPLRELAFILEFPIEVYPIEGRASGWFISEDNTFDLDLGNQLVTVQGIESTFNKRQIEIHDNDIFVHSELLSDWLGIRFNIDLLKMAVTIDADTPLPFQQRMAREQARGYLGDDDAAEKFHPLVTQPYQIIGWPSLQFDADYNFDQASVEQHRSRYSANIYGEFLWMSTNVYAGGDDDDSLSELRLEMSRYDSNHQLLGLGASELRLGDLFVPRVNLLSESGEARGIVINNDPLERPNDFSSTELRGDLPPGWDLELYRNGSLYDSVDGNNTGRYEFLDVPLFYGNNLLKLVFYGPQGQIREEIQTINVDGGQLAPKSYRYQVAALQTERALFDVSDDGNRYDDDSQDLISVELGVGLTNALSMEGRIMHANSDQLPSQTLYGLGVTTGIWGSAIALDVGFDDDSGTAAELNLQTRLGDINLNLSHTEYDDFIALGENQITTEEAETELRLDGTINVADLRFRNSLETNYQKRTNDQKSLLIDYRLSTYFNAISLSNVLSWDRNISDNDNRLYGETTFNTPFFFAGDLRANLNYQIEPHGSIDSARMRTDWRRESYSLGVDVTHYTNSGDTKYGFDINKEFANLTLGLNASYSDDDKLYAGISLSLVLGHNPINQSVYLTARDTGNQAPVFARTYIDNNNNGRFDNSDEPLTGAYFAHDNDSSSDNNGLIHTTVASNRRVNIELDADSLSDPYLRSTAPAFSLYPRSGSPIIVDVPLVVTGEMEGTTYLEQNNATRAIGNVKLQLMKGSDVILETTSSYDGFYLFDGVLPGDYRLRVDPQQIKRLSLTPVSEQNVSIKNNGEVIIGVDFYLKQEVTNTLR